MRKYIAALLFLFPLSALADYTNFAWHITNSNDPNGIYSSPEAACSRHGTTAAAHSADTTSVSCLIGSSDSGGYAIVNPSACYTGYTLQDASCVAPACAQNPCQANYANFAWHVTNSNDPNGIYPSPEAACSRHGTAARVHSADAASVSCLVDGNDSGGYAIVSPSICYTGYTLQGSSCTANSSASSFSWRVSNSNDPDGIYASAEAACSAHGTIAAAHDATDMYVACLFNGSPSGGVASVIAAPSVSLTAPANNASYIVPANILLSANAADSGGSINSVAFYNGTTLLGAATTAPYTFNWSNITIGSYLLTAVATDNDGATNTSAIVTITVAAVNAAPTVNLITPSNSQTFIAPATVTLAANAADADGTVAKVEFYEGATLLGTATSAPHSISWNNVVPGSYALLAKATDNLGAVTTSAAVNITVAANQVPAVSVSATPITAAAPATVTLSATASDADGTVAKMEFFNGATLLATVTQAPYTYGWTNVAAGNYTVTAKATDNGGAATVSAPVTVTIGGGAVQAYYIDNDHLGTPRVITNQNNQVVWQWDNSDPYGNNVPNADPGNTGTPMEFNLRYPGQYFDKETNLHYNYFRTYDPATGTYTTFDPLGLAAGINGYAYVKGNPVSNIDPEGLMCFNFDKFANQVRDNRADNALTLGSLIAAEGVGTMPKTPGEMRALGLPKSEINPITNQLSRWSGRFGTRALREIGRTTAGIVAGTIATGAVVLEGFYDLGVIGKAAVDATTSDDCGCK